MNYVKKMPAHLRSKIAFMQNHSTTCLLLILYLCLPFSCLSQPVRDFHASMQSVKQIPLPAGFERVAVMANSFAGYLRNLPLRKDKTIYLYNHQPKTNQSLHYAVIDISTGDKDLQQCADAVMRLRAEYFYDKKMYDSIRFLKDNHSFYCFSNYRKSRASNERESFMLFMETVFINCGTYSLQQQLKPIPDFSTIQTGDVLIKAGAPGHAEIVVDMAIHKETGKKIFLLLEGYMPAQDMHILLHPANKLSPWYEIPNSKELITASWIFTTDQLRRW